MARFGLLSSDDDEETSAVNRSSSSAASSSSRSPSPPPTKQLRRSTHADDDDSEEDAERSRGDGSDDADEDDRQQTRELSVRRRRTRSSSGSSSSSYRSPPLNRRRQQGDTSLVHRAKPADDSAPWPKTLGLQPKRIAVMQASFFHQPTPPPVATRGMPTARSGAAIEPMATNVREMMDLDEASLMKTINSRENKAPASSSTPKTAAVPASLSLRSGFSAAMPAAPLSISAINLYQASTPLASSLTLDAEGCFVDGGLALGRSYRVGWGPKAQLISLDKHDKEIVSRDTKRSAGTDEIRASPLRYTEHPSTAIDPVPVLQLQLSHTTIVADPVSLIPSATPDASLRFHHFTSLSTAPHPAPAALFTAAAPSPVAYEAQRKAIEAESQLWKLGHALFDEIDDLHLDDRGAVEEDQAVRTRVVALRRRNRVENWLKDVVRREVEEDLRSLAASSVMGGSAASTSGADRIFALLTGHQVPRACSSAVASNDLRLATLVAQAADGGAIDDGFRSDIYLQLVKWREYGVEEWVSTGVRRVYALLCGEIGGQPVDAALPRGEKEAETIHVMKGLDWKRAFGVYLWFGLGNSAGGAEGMSTLENAVELYEMASTRDPVVARPSPSYCVSSTTSATPIPPSTGELPTDPLFHLLKLFTSPTHPLESCLLPTNFGASSLDYRLPWTLYLLLSRVLRRRDFEDRIMVDQEDAMESEEQGPEGNSVRADMVTMSYANQLEVQGKWRWAVFVLLHLELAELRAKAIKDVLGRNAPRIQQDDYEYLTQVLKIPGIWVYSAQASITKYNGQLYLHYQLLLEANEQTAAHAAAVQHLLPEAIIRQDLALVRKLLARFEPHLVEQWEEGGKVFLDYADCIDSLSEPGPHIQHLEPVMLRLIQDVPRLIEVGGHGLKLAVCIAEMQKRLIELSSRLYNHSAAIDSQGLPEADRLVWLQGANNSFLNDSFERAQAA